MNGQISLVLLWMYKLMRQQSNQNCCQQKISEISLNRQPNRLELVLHGEQNQVYSTAEVCWKYFCILLWFLFYECEMDQN